MNTRLWVFAAVLFTVPATAADWPQWRGPNRDARVTGFQAPATWPKTLTRKWKVAVGDGVSTPALVGDRLYVFSREGGDEIIRCLAVADGAVVWSGKYPADPGVSMRISADGPRASPIVTDGKVVTFGVQSTLSCWDAASGSKVWQKESLGSTPRYSTASSPIIVNGPSAGERIVISEYGGQGGGGLVAYDLTTGNRKWLWDGDGAAYASPVMMTVGGTGAIVAETSGNIVAVNAADGKLLWKTPFKERYNASSTVVDGQTIIYSGNVKGTFAVRAEKGADGFTTKDLWNSKTGAIYNTPVVKDGWVYGVSDKDDLFCLSLADGKRAWTTKLHGSGGFATVVDAGSVLFALTSSGELTVFEPSDKEFKKVASYTVGNGTYGYPVITDKRIFIKDKNDVALWAIE
jgi:outer membrane protein assembly factor BamB